MATSNAAPTSGEDLDPAKKKGGTSDANAKDGNGTQHSDDTHENEDSKDKTTDVWANMVSDPKWWELGSLGDQVKKAATTVGSIAENTWDGMVTSLWGPSTANPANPGDRSAEQPKPEEKKGFFSWVGDTVKGAADAIAKTFSSAWDKVFGDTFGKDSTHEVIDSDRDGKADTVKVVQKNGDKITTDANKTTIEKSDGTIVTRQNGETTVEKNGIKITRDARGHEVITYKDGTKAEVKENGDLSVEAKGLLQEVRKDGVYGQVVAADGTIRTFLNTKNRYDSLTQAQRDKDVVNAGDQTVMRVDKENGIHAIMSKADGDRRAIFRKEGSDEIVQVGVVDGHTVMRVGKIGADGKPDLSSFHVPKDDEIPQWFKEHGKRHCHGRIPQTPQELMDAAGVKIQNGGLAITEGNMTASRDAKGNPDVAIARSADPKDVVILRNENGVQKVEDVKNNTVSTYDGHNFNQQKDGVNQLSYDRDNRHLQVFDERGNLYADSTRAGTRFADGSSIGSDASYTSSSGQRYFSGSPQEVQYAGTVSTQALATSQGSMDAVRAQLANKGATVDIGSLTNSLGSLTEALALCIKSGNFTNLNSIISNMGTVQDLIARGYQHNNDINTVKAAVPDATPEQIAATKPGPNDASVAQLERVLQTKRVSA